MTSILQGLDRWLLLHRPTLWLTRVHVITVVGFILAILCALIGISLPMRPYYTLKSLEAYYGLRSTLTSIHTMFTMALVVTGFGTVYWAYIQARNQEAIPFTGRRWMFPIYGYCIGFLNMGPLIMAYIYDLRVLKVMRAHPMPKFPMSEYLITEGLKITFASNMTYWAGLVGLEIALLLNALRGGISGRKLSAMFSGTLIGLLLTFIANSAFTELESAVAATLALAYVVTVLGATCEFALPLSRVRVLMAFFHVSTPILPPLILLRLEDTPPYIGGNDTFNYPLLLAVTAVSYAVISYPLEMRLARLRANPA